MMDVSASAAWRYLYRTLRSYLPFMGVAAVFLTLGLLAGAVGGVLVAEDTENDVLDEGEAVSQDSDWFPELTTESLFFHNTTVALIFVVSGVYTATIGTILQLLYNGFVIGAVGAIAGSRIGVAETVMLLVPHGVFEIPALLLAAAIPFRFWYLVWKRRRSDGDGGYLEGHHWDVVTALAVVVVGLLIAAAIEARLTETIADAVVGLPG